MTKIGVLGGGSFGTAIIKTLSEKRQDIHWWVRQQKSIDYIIKNGRNPKYLRAVDLELNNDHLSSDFRKVVNSSDILFIAVPSLFLRQAFLDIKPVELKDKLIISTTKGLIPHDHQLISEYFLNFYEVPRDQFIFLTGPSHAEEIVTKRSTYLTLASTSVVNAMKAGSYLETSHINIRTSTDVVGLEYAAVLKNIYAIAAGISQSVGYGDNFLAVLMSNAIREMNRLLKHECPADRNLMTSGYLGDLLVTAFSQFSRNRTLGSMVGHGYSPKAALIEMKMIPEGYYGVKSFCKIMRESSVRLDIVAAVYKILYKQEDPLKTLQELEGKFD